MRRRMLAALGTFSLLATTVTAMSVAEAAEKDDAETNYGRMMLVLDSSGSMSEKASGDVSKLTAAKQSLNQVVDQLPGEAYVGLRVYGAKVFSKARNPKACTDSQLAVEPGTDNRDDLRSAISDYRAYGETPTGYALQEAAKDIGSEGERSIVLVSDGVSNCDPDPCEVAADIAGKGIDLQIDVVGLDVNSKARRELQCVANKGGGTYYDAKSADEIVESLSHVASRAARPFTLDGERVEGTPKAADAPSLAPGKYIDTLGGNGDALHYQVPRSASGTTLHFSVLTQGVVGNAHQDWDKLDVTATAPNGAECATGSDQKLNENSGIVSTAVVVDRHSVLYDNPQCWKADEITFKVARGSISDTPSSDIGVIVSEEPPVENIGALPPEKEPDRYIAPDTDGKAKPVVGGQAFDDATLLKTGSYRGSVVPGEVQLFRVPLEWGQRVSAGITFDAPSAKVLDRIGTFDEVSTRASLEVFSPMRGAMDAYYDNVTDSDMVFDDSRTRLGTMSQPVRYRNRESPWANKAYVPGDYYLLVRLDDLTDTKLSPVLSYTLDVEVQGDPSGAPTYADDASYGGPASDDDAGGEPGSGSGDGSEGDATDGGDDAADASASADDGDGVSAETLMAGAVGAAGVACVVLGGVLLRRQRRTR